MKRFALISMIVLGAAGAWAQDLATFQTGFTKFSETLSPTLSYNATVGNNWSDAYIGGFPHFGAGIALGATTVPLEGIEGLLASMGNIAVPAALKQIGLPIPAVAVSAKLGGFILPFDIGLKAMFLPQSVTAKLSALGISADYTLIGGNIRYAVLKENLVLPDVSIGAGYNRLSGAAVMPLGVSGQSFTFTTPDSVSHTLAVTDPDLALRWTTNSYDFTLQVSKKLLFVTPYAGLGFSVGNSSVLGGIESALTYDGNTVTEAELTSIKAQLASANIDVPDLSAEGFLFGAESSVPTIRVYGGVSLAFLILNLDVAATYVPATKSLGGSAMIRVQL